MAASWTLSKTGHHSRESRKSQPNADNAAGAKNTGASNRYFSNDTRKKRRNGRSAPKSQTCQNRVLGVHLSPLSTNCMPEPLRPHISCGYPAVNMDSLGSIGASNIRPLRRSEGTRRITWTPTATVALCKRCAPEWLTALHEGLSRSVAKMWSNSLFSLAREGPGARDFVRA